MAVTYTIQKFSEKTGIPKSTLRYYETIDLLHSVARKNNGYRTYSQEQIPLAKLIVSLRIANIPIKDIQSYVKVNKNKQQKMINSWRTQLKQNIDMLRVGLQYLESGLEGSEVYLLEKESEKIIWFEAEEKVGNFGKQFKKYRNILASKGIPVMNHYLKYISGENKILASIGFGVRKREDVSSLLEEMRVENMQKTLCIAMPFNRQFNKIEEGYQYLLQYAKKHEWIPAGSIFEWYRGDQYEEMDIMMPVLKLGDNNVKS